MIELKNGESVSLTNGSQAKVVKELGRAIPTFNYRIAENETFNCYREMLDVDKYIWTCMKKAVCSVLSFVLMLVRGMYGKWLYRKSAADHIRRIQSEFPDARQRQAVLRAQGGVSFGAVFLCGLLLSVCGSAFTLLLGPDLQAILNAFYG